MADTSGWVSMAEIEQRAFRRTRCRNPRACVGVRVRLAEADLTGPVRDFRAETYEQLLGMR